MSGSNTPPPPYPPQGQPPVPAPGAYPGYPPAPGYPVYPQYPQYPASPGYPPQTQVPGPAGPGWAPNPTEAAHYGQVGRVPWSLRQTVIGATLTIVPWLAFIVVTQLAAGTSSGTSTRLSPTADLLAAIFVLAFTVVIEGAFLLAPLYFALKRRPAGFTRADGLRALGLRKAPFWRSVGWVALGFMIVLAATVVYGLIIDHFKLTLQTNGQALENQVRYAPITVTATLIAAVFVAPFCEELFFRGYLFGGMLRGMNVWLAVPLSALLFTLVHGDIGSAALLLVIGLVLAAMRYRLGSIWPGIALHALNNGLAAVSVLLILTQK